MAAEMTRELKAIADAAIAAGQLITERYAIYRDDCMNIMKGLPKESVHFSCYSPPFAGLYQYSSDPSDVSNCKDYQEFLDHMGYVVRELHRLTMPGRMTAVHCQDVYTPSGDVSYLTDLPGDLWRVHEANGWKCVARYQVWKEPLLVRNRTMLKSLHHKTLCEDSTKTSIANADTLLVFRRSGQNAIPVAHPVGLTSYAGSNKPPENILRWKGYKGNQIKNQYSQWCWRQYASSFWQDVRIDRVLPHREAKDEQDEKHVHPLQADIIERATILYTNPGEVVFTPFMGVGSEVFFPVELGRKGIGIELKPAYFAQAVKNLLEAKLIVAREQAEVEHDNADLFAGVE